MLASLLSWPWPKSKAKLVGKDGDVKKKHRMRFSFPVMAVKVLCTPTRRGIPDPGSRRTVQVVRLRERGSGGGPVALWGLGVVVVVDFILLLAALFEGSPPGQFAAGNSPWEWATGSFRAGMMMVSREEMHDNIDPLAQWGDNRGSTARE